LLNYNVYDFGLKGDLREKVKLSLNKKEKVEVEKKESKIFSKTKTEQVKVEQKEEDIETLMTEQFMNFTHFVFQARPTSDNLKAFISKEHDIIGQLQFNWIDIPQ
jgi:aspartyl/asparaginyl-tRNA synthetase